MFRDGSKMFHKDSKKNWEKTFGKNFSQKIPKIWPEKDHFPYELKKRLKKGADCYAKDRKTQIKNEKKAS